MLPICYLMLSGRKDPVKNGLMYLCTFCLLKLSGERSFGVALNKPYQVAIYSIVCLSSAVSVIMQPCDCIYIITSLLFNCLTLFIIIYNLFMICCLVTSSSRYTAVHRHICRLTDYSAAQDDCFRLGEVAVFISLFPHHYLQRLALLQGSVQCVVHQADQPLSTVYVPPVPVPSGR